MNYEFNGTKGNWKQFCNGYFYDIKTSEDGYCQTFARVYENAYLPADKKTTEYNAILISKAPELLEELKHCVEALEVFDMEGTSLITDRVKQLLKDATTLPNE